MMIAQKQFYAASWLALVVCLLFAGCGQNPVVADADKTDSNGYVCGKCGYKFYTDDKVYAEFCPKCKDTYIRPVVAYVCEKDKHLTLSASTHGTVECEQCKTPTAVTRMPRSADLKTWGAEKKEKAEVCR